MATTKLLQLYRNSTIAEDLSAAKTLIENNKKEGADGEILIARYKDTDNSNAPKALVGIYNEMSGQTATLTYLESVSMEDVQSTVETAIETALEGLTGGGEGTTGQFVTEVTEENGVISVTYGAITSEDGTVVVNGYDLGVNYDNDTIVLDSNGKLSVSEGAGGGYTGADAIAIDGKEISLTIDSDDKVLSQSTDGLKTTLGIDYVSDDHTVVLKGIDGEVISSFDASEFIVDGMITDVELVHENPETGATGEFIMITWNIEGGETKTIYLDVTELIDVYTAGNGIDITDNEVSVKVADTSESFLTVGESGLTLNGVQDAIDAASAAATTVVAKDSEASHLTLTSETDSSTGATTYTIGENDIASASDLSDLQTEVESDETIINNIITSAGLNEDGTLTDVTLPGSSTNLVDAITELESEITSLQSEVSSIEITSSDNSITVDGYDVIVALSAVSDSEYATDMIVKDTDGGLAMNPVIDCGEY